MAILYGTQSNGETLPVQVNSFGQLVAQGLDGAKGEKGDKGEKGEQGQKGEQGEPGPAVQYVKTTWTPEIAFDGDGAAMIEYEVQSGDVYDLGGLTIISCLVRLVDIGVTNARGRPYITGMPVFVNNNSTFPIRDQGFTNRTTLFKGEGVITPVLRGDGAGVLFAKTNNGLRETIATTDINAPFENQQELSFTFLGIRATPLQVVQQQKEFEQSLANS